MNNNKAALDMRWWVPPWLVITLLVLGDGSRILAGPVPKNLALPETKWVLHLDMDALRKTDLYQYLIQKDQLKNLLHFSLSINDQDLKLDFSRCHSLTAYGTDLDFESEGVVGMIQMPADYRQEMLDTLAKLAKAESSTLQPSQGKKAWNGYTLDEELHIYSPTRDLFVFGAEQITWKTCTLAAGKGATRVPDCLADFPAKLEPFIYIAYAGEIKEDAQLPFDLNFNLELPQGATNTVGDLGEFLQLEVFSKIDRASFHLGEATNQLWSSLVLKTRTSETARQIQKALKPITSLTRLIQATNQPLQKFMQCLAVTTNKNLVIMAISHPTLLDGRNLYEVIEAAAHASQGSADQTPPKKETP